jgi:hypothetical protein
MYFSTRERASSGPPWEGYGDLRPCGPWASTSFGQAAAMSDADERASRVARASELAWAARHHRPPLMCVPPPAILDFPCFVKARDEQRMRRHCCSLCWLPRTRCTAPTAFRGAGGDPAGGRPAPMAGDQRRCGEWPSEKMNIKKLK